MTTIIDLSRLDSQAQHGVRERIRQRRNEIGPDEIDDADALLALCAERRDALVASREIAELEHYFSHGGNVVEPRAITAAVGLGGLHDSDCGCAL